MGALKYAILGLLNRENMTGYDLTKYFNNDLFECWHANHSQIYPELKKLTKLGLVDYEIKISGNSLEKKVYSLTPQGKEGFDSWVKSDHQTKGTSKDEFRLQLYFSDYVTKEEQLEILNKQLDIHKNRLKAISEKQNKFGTIPPENQRELSDYMVMLGAIMQEKYLCNWLEQCIELNQHN